MRSRKPALPGVTAELDLTEHGDETTAEYYVTAARRIRQRMDAFYERGIDGSAHAHVSAFGMTPIPLLVEFGRALSDKVDLDLFQRHHKAEKPWVWQTTGVAARYERRLLQRGNDPFKVALLLSLSGVIDLGTVPAEIRDECFLYEIVLVSETPHREFLRQRRDLVEFRRVYEAFLSHLVAERHGGPLSSPAGGRTRTAWHSGETCMALLSG